MPAVKKQVVNKGAIEPKFDLVILMSFLLVGKSKFSVY